MTQLKKCLLYKHKDFGQAPNPIYEGILSYDFNLSTGEAEMDGTLGHTGQLFFLSMKQFVSKNKIGTT